MLESNTSVASINLESETELKLTLKTSVLGNNAGDAGTLALAKALEKNTSVTNINLGRTASQLLFL